MENRPRGQASKSSTRAVRAIIFCLGTLILSIAIQSAFLVTRPQFSELSRREDGSALKLKDSVPGLNNTAITEATRSSVISKRHSQDFQSALSRGRALRCRLRDTSRNELSSFTTLDQLTGCSDPRTSNPFTSPPQDVVDAAGPALRDLGCSTANPNNYGRVSTGWGSRQAQGASSVSHYENATTSQDGVIIALDNISPRTACGNRRTRFDGYLAVWAGGSQPDLRNAIRDQMFGGEDPYAVQLPELQHWSDVTSIVYRTLIAAVSQGISGGRLSGVFRHRRCQAEELIDNPIVEPLAIDALSEELTLAGLNKRVSDSDLARIQTKHGVHRIRQNSTEAFRTTKSEAIEKRKNLERGDYTLAQGQSPRHLRWLTDASMLPRLPGSFLDIPDVGHRPRVYVIDGRFRSTHVDFGFQDSETRNRLSGIFGIPRNGPIEDIRGNPGKPTTNNQIREWSHGTCMATLVAGDYAGTCKNNVELYLIQLTNGPGPGSAALLWLGSFMRALQVIIAEVGAHLHWQTRTLFLQVGEGWTYVLIRQYTAHEDSQRHHSAAPSNTSQTRSGGGERGRERCPKGSSL
ncbi:hypothetical protein B0H66DRAFT_532097 [Apodospora peruviana]|uniref:Uncharacterized protein n=1 Tax=Apodospora peruviana TaxID=516989 RepID=A0AAE0IEG5_9PEZI|nr:hypothetical protein B0H66DRAFT_532097 [Apodospora peruviana]